uniref:Uncharacterized protein n=1 Tax=Amphimedon queenslandica TaxID=400682 RepID=A0A1X7V501_AMPQE
QYLVEVPGIQFHCKRRYLVLDINFNK